MTDRVEKFTTKAREVAEVKEKLTTAVDLLRRTGDDVARLEAQLKARTFELNSFLGAGTPSRLATLLSGRVLLAEYMNDKEPPRIRIFNLEGELCR